MQERYQFEEHMRKSYERLGFPLCVFQNINGQYVTLLVSDGALELFGGTREQVVSYLDNKSYRKMHPDDAGKVREASRLFETKEEQCVLCRMMVGDSYHVLMFHERRHVMDDKTPLYFVTYSDITVLTGDTMNSYHQYLDNQQELLLKDTVTDLPNINFYQAFAGGVLKEHLGNRRIPAIVFFDIKGMHAFNDRYGYQEGNTLLHTTARIIRRHFPEDFLVRYTEDHFVVITDGRNPADQIEAVRHDLAAKYSGARIGIKAGIFYYDDMDLDIVAAVDRARLAVDYISDRKDRSVCTYDDEVRSFYNKRNYVLEHYDEAIQKGWIRVYYQPIVGVLSKKVSRFEALSRWIDPVYGFMNPSDFISILEEAHLIFRLDLYVLEVICRSLRERRDKGLPYAFVTVNLSRYDLEQPDIHDTINATLHKYGIDPKEIVLEITESALLDHEELIREHIDRFHKDGYAVWLDDFGSGYSSFNAVQNFDFDCIKIDMQFLRSENKRTPDILMDIIDMTKRLGIDSLTEGVETRQHYELLRSFGCGMIQGFWISKPLPEEEIFPLLADRGLTMETPDDHEYFRAVTGVNVLDTLQPLRVEGAHTVEKPRILEIITQKADRVMMTYTNSSAREWNRSYGIQSREELDAALNDEEGGIFQNIRDHLKYLKNPGDIIEIGVNDPRFTGRMRIQLITEVGDRRAFLVTGIEIDYSTLQVLNQERQYILDQYSEAMRSGLIVPKFRPIVDADRREVAMTEAYPYWRDPSGTSPTTTKTLESVLAAARLSRSLDLFMLEKVCRILSDRTARGMRVVPVGLRLHADDFFQDDFIAQINGTLERYRIPHEMILFRLKGEDLLKGGQAIPHLRREGYAVGVYELGMGLDFYHFLETTTIDYYRIDLDGLTTIDERSRRVMKNLMDMLEICGIQPLARNVRSAEQETFLKSIGCSLLQGPYIGKSDYASRFDADSYDGIYPMRDCREAAQKADSGQDRSET